MKTARTRLLSLLLCALLLAGCVPGGLGLIRRAAAAENSYGMTATVKFFRQVNGSWVETTRAKPGETLRAELYVSTEYYTTAMMPGLEFDDRYFNILNRENAGTAAATPLSTSAIANTGYQNGTTTISGWPADYYGRRNMIMMYLINGGLVDRTAFGNYELGFISGLMTFDGPSQNLMLTDDAYLVALEGIKVNNTAYVRNPDQVGEMWLPADLATTNSLHGVVNFPKVEPNGTVSSAKNTGDGWTMVPTVNRGQISVFSNFALDANGGAFVDGTTQAPTRAVAAGVIGETVGTYVNSLAGVAPQRPGYAFLGWSLTPDGAIVTADQLQTMQLGYDDIQLYAQWEALSPSEGAYEIARYYMNADGTYPDIPIVETVSSVMPGTYEIPTDTAEPGYVLDESMPNVLSVTVNNDGTASGSGAVYLKLQTYALTYHYVDGADSAQTDVYDAVRFGEALPAFLGGAEDVPAPAGHQFVGWSTAENDPSCLIDIDGATMPMNDWDLYAIYETEAYTLTLLDSNGMVLTELTFPYGTLVAEDSVPGGYGGWVDSATGEAVSFPFTLTADTVLQAQPAIHSVTFVLNGGEINGSGDDLVYEFAEGAPIIPPADPVREDYVFLGWGLAESPVMGAADETYTAQWEKMPIVISAHSLSLNGDIGVNFYVDIPLATDAAYVEITVEGETTRTVPIDRTKYSMKNGRKLYKFSCAVNSAQTDMDILCVAHNGDDQTSEVYSVHDYLTTAMTNPSTQNNAKLMALMRSIATYGYYANELLGIDSEFEQHVLFDSSLIAGISAATVADKEGQFTDGETGVTYVGSSLVLRSETLIRHYFKLPAGKTPDDYIIQLGTGSKATVLTPRPNGKYYYVETLGIPSAELGDARTVTVKDAATGAVVNTWVYSAMSYVQHVLSLYEANDPSVSEALANAVKALTAYYQAAYAYFKT